MKRVLTQAIIFLSLLLVVTVVTLPYGSYKGKGSLLPWLKERAFASSHITLNAEDLILEFPLTFRLKEANLLVPVYRILFPLPITKEIADANLLVPVGSVPFPFPLLIESATATLKLLPLCMLRTSVIATANLYGGELHLQATKPIFGTQNELEGHLDHLRLQSHPLLQGVGISGLISGNVKTQATTIPQSLAQLDYAEVELSLNQGSFHETQSILPLVKLPEVENIQAKITMQLRKNRLSLSDARLDCSLGKISGSGTGNLSPLGLLSSGTASFSLSLTEEGKKSLGGYLALLAGVPVDNPSSNWRIDVELLLGQKPRVGIHQGNS